MKSWSFILKAISKTRLEKDYNLNTTSLYAGLYHMQQYKKNWSLPFFRKLSFQCLLAMNHCVHLHLPSIKKTGAGQKFEWTKVRVKQNLYILNKNQFEQICKRFYCLVPHHSSYNILINGNKKIIWAKYLFTRTFCPRPVLTA